MTGNEVAPGSNAPPDAAAAPEGAVDRIELGGRINRKSTDHNAAECATCHLGIQPWTPERRERAVTYSTTSGRRICDLPMSSKEVRARV